MLPLRTKELPYLPLPDSSPAFSALSPTGSDDSDGYRGRQWSKVEYYDEGDATDPGQAQHAPSTRGLSTRATRLLYLVVATVLIAVTLFVLPVRLSASPVAPPPSSNAWTPPCSPSAWSNGSWVPRSVTLPPAATIWDATGFTGAAQNWFRNDWHLGLFPPGAVPGSEGEAGPDGEWPMSPYRRQAAGWVWQSAHEECAVVEPVEAEAEKDGRVKQDEAQVVQLLQDLIDRGGWLIIGDSLSEQQFFSLGCMLFPHVRALWPYPPMSMWVQIKEEHLLLKRDSPWVMDGTLHVPDDWDFDGSPLVSHVRTDHGVAPAELVDLYAALHDSPSLKLSLRYPALTSLPRHADANSILTDVETFSPNLDYYLSLFLRPAAPRNISTEISPSYAQSTTPPDALVVEREATRSAKYRTLIFSTGAHFSSRHFNLPDGAVPYSQPASTAPDGTVMPAREGTARPHVEYFELVLSSWIERVARALDEASPEEREGKAVLVRPTSNGHDDCHAATGPMKEVDEGRSSWYSWSEIQMMNRRGQVLVDEVAHPQITFLEIGRPAKLRPDAHTNDDCLHLSTGTGVIEGWTHYIAYWLRERAAFEEGARPDSAGWRARLEQLVPWRL
ncbi:hypothetical protein Rhopal_007502-T1 [Rhodotorula paludigena]|uniref:Uncharacterized protein n=1 Tax=Rhodotorula paludigena TaxID=86838 RepID=A0AAV5GYI5_9BASI|nr:hypothetical protein Rhopal_007502-T1 [Rhodotorula paludigena]